MEDNSSSSNCTTCCLLLGLSRILCYKCCCCACKGRRGAYAEAPAVDFNVLCVGIEGAGKSTVLASLAGESTDDIPPTTGFTIKIWRTKGSILHIKELGGSEKIRKYWNRYYDGQQGVIAIIDSSGEDPAIESQREALRELLDDPRLQGLPHLILYHSKGGTPVATVDHRLESLISTSQSCVLVRTCSGLDRDRLRSIFEEYAHLLTDCL